MFKDSGLQQAGMEIWPNDNWDKMMIKKINKVHFRWNVFFEVTNGDGSSTLIPVEFQQSMMVGFRPGIRSIYG